MAMAGALLVTVTLGAATGGASYIDTRQREAIFRPERIEGAFEARRHGIEEVEIPVVEDGLPGQMHAWWWPAGPGAPALLYLHGARFNLWGNARRIERFREMGFSVLAVDYRGFGRSTGQLPSEAQVYRDAEVAWRWLKSRVPDGIGRYVLGHSLGGAVAIELATRHADMAGLIVESTFTSMRDMADQFSPLRWLPVDLLLTQHFTSIDKIARITVPTLFVHGQRDAFVPSWMTERLYERAGAPKSLWLCPDGAHSNVVAISYEQYRDRVRAFFGMPRLGSDP